MFPLKYMFLQNASRDFVRHNTCIYHEDAIAAAKEFIIKIEKLPPSVLHQVNSQHEEDRRIRIEA